MVTESEISEMIGKAKEGAKKLKFKQSVELIMTFKDIDVKKGFAINETVQLAKTSAPAQVCVMATGDMNLKAKTAKADMVVDTDGLNKLGANKRESRKFVGKYDFFLADTKLMPLVGKVLGQILGPRGKMPTPVPLQAPSLCIFLEALLLVCTFAFFLQGILCCFFSFRTFLPCLYDLFYYWTHCCLYQNSLYVFLAVWKFLFNGIYYSDSIRSQICIIHPLVAYFT